MRRRFVVHGVVQGVFFRAHAVDQARRLGLTGRVRNRPDGAVECVAEGEGPVLDRLAGWLREGPRDARVDRVEVTELEGPARYQDFRTAWGAID